jgi:FkbM family methyltransferase
VRHPSAAGAVARWRPFSITSFEMARTLRALGLRPRTVIDGGANVGQFARAMAETFPEAEVIAFEPLPGPAARFRAHLADCPRVRLIQSALGDTEGSIPFYPQAYDLASSALPPTGRPAPASIEVPVSRLDTLLAEALLPGPVLLKLDLQGYELEALRGATRTLQRVDHVLLEVGFDEAYEGEASFDALYDHLRQSGFRLLRPVDALRGPSGDVVQMDVLFERER